MFGFPARRVVTTVRKRPLAPPSDDDSETTTDGWYVDIDPVISCERLPPGSRTFLTIRTLGGPDEIPQFKDIGPRERGFAVDTTSTHVSHATLPDGTTKTFTSTSRTLVTHLSTDPIDPALFEIPPDFRKRR